MARQIRQNEAMVQALALLDQVTALLDASGLMRISVHTDHARQLLDQTMHVPEAAVFGASPAESLRESRIE